MPPSITNAQLSLLREQLITLDFEEPDDDQCQAIEKVCVDLLRAGQLEAIKNVVLEVQQVWGTLPEKPLYRGRVRFFPQINPLAHFTDSNDTAFLKSINKNYFGFSAAGLALDVPERMFGTREGYLRSVGLIQALIAHKDRFAAFHCDSRGQVGAYLQLLSDDSASHGEHWDFVKKGEVDFTHYRVWAFSSGMLHYPACEGFMKACGFGPEFVKNTDPESPRSDSQLANQKILLKCLGTSDGPPTIRAFQDFVRNAAGDIMSAVPFYDRLAKSLAADQGIDLAKTKLLIGKALLGMNYGHDDTHAKIAGDIIDWLGTEIIGKLYKQEALEYFYDFTKSRALLPFISRDSKLDNHFALDLGL
ncbi:hypothetical protein [Pseudomonas amygdali]|uniref:Uncharacterized protein n=2 Tax=Pseudomonas amygdali pv. lachrymans TaxID=53707 RepID=A0ABR5KSE7_PSEAV|nr:hypothetical protein [Pseudomonas amygdali]AXH60338.1 hypothetical protein PLA107_034720 [Pseudomonas amygdali pv. lachrymans str. M301315]KPC17728.1 Uncharacterized protein AC499_0930 [Pseudomonas amygdali pv. lachrymans]RMT06269.1 hypothetical protein ALP54_04147 [Pseudomonas amygdali pv. lachrymans]